MTSYILFKPNGDVILTDDIQVVCEDMPLGSYLFSKEHSICWYKCIRLHSANSWDYIDEKDVPKEYLMMALVL